MHISPSVIADLNSSVEKINHKIEKLETVLNSVDSEKKQKIMQAKDLYEIQLADINNLYNETILNIRSDIQLRTAERVQIQKALANLTGISQITATQKTKSNRPAAVETEEVRDKIINALFIKNNRNGLTVEEIYRDLVTQKIFEPTRNVLCMGGILGAMAAKGIIYKTNGRYRLTDDKIYLEKLGLRKSVIEILESISEKITVDDMYFKLKSVKGMKLPEKKTSLRGILLGMSRSGKVTRSSDNGVEYYQIGK